MAQKDEEAPQEALEAPQGASERSMQAETRRARDAVLQGRAERKTQARAAAEKAVGSKVEWLEE